MYYGMEFSERTVALARQAESDCAEVFSHFEEICMRCSAKVLRAFQRHRVSTVDFLEVTGYGFYDGGREKLEALYADVFGAEDSLSMIHPQEYSRETHNRLLQEKSFLTAHLSK